MKILGIITEYNPFHNGHLHHLEESIKLSGADYVVCVMSGNFIQRGEPAIVNKWARTRMALNAGIDLVIELPVVYSMSSAEYFGYGAVKILDSLNIVDYICFGSECGEIEILEEIAEIFLNEPPEFQATIKRELKKGISYPKARGNALLSLKENLNNKYNDIINNSNNILGIEYIKALKKLKSKIVPLTIKRVSNNYNCIEITGKISSATAIRNLLENKIDEQILDLVPKYTYDILVDEFNNGRGPITYKSFENIILSFIRKTKPSEIIKIPDVNEGLENRILSSAKISGTLKELFENLKTKRYTNTRLQRILMHFITGITKTTFELFNKYNGPQYARVLGFNKNGQNLLKLLKHKAHIPVIIKRTNFIKTCNPLLKEMLEIEDISTDIYVLAYTETRYKYSGQEYTQNIIVK